jgi:hypothetical protein
LLSIRQAIIYKSFLDITGVHARVNPEIIDSYSRNLWTKTSLLDFNIPSLRFVYSIT